MKSNVVDFGKPELLGPRTGKQGFTQAVSDQFPRDFILGMLQISETGREQNGAWDGSLAETPA